MPNRKKPFVPLPPPPRPCVCVAAAALTCLESRHDISSALARIMEGCQCGCHYNRFGEQIDHHAWHPIIQTSTQRTWTRGPSEVK